MLEIATCERWEVQEETTAALEFSKQRESLHRFSVSNTQD